MFYFPQLGSGAMAQYPLVKRRVCRTVSNRLAGGRMIKLADPGAARLEWEFTFNGLSDQERESLEHFVDSVEGRLREFTLLDPTDNLLAWSGDLEASAWSSGPLISLNGGVGDPNGGTGAFGITNTGTATQSIEQTIAGPGWYWYCFSLYARSGEGSTITLFRSSGDVSEERSYGLSAHWTRLALSGKTQTTAQSVTFGVALPPAAAVEVYGAQAEAQPAPSTYRRTTTRRGIYHNARFEDDVFWLVTEGPDEHSCRVRVGAPLTG